MNKRLARTILAGILAVCCFSAAAAAQELAVTVKDVESFPYLAIAHKGPYTDMGTVIGQLVGAMQAQGLFPKIRGPLVGVYFNAPGAVAPEELSWEAGFVVDALASPNPPLVKKVWEYRTVAAALYVGPYDGAGPAIEKIMAWIEAHGYESAGPVLERYLDQNPSAVKPEALRTEIWIPVVKR